MLHVYRLITLVLFLSGATTNSPNKSVQIDSGLISGAADSRFPTRWADFRSTALDRLIYFRAFLASPLHPSQIPPDRRTGPEVYSVSLVVRVSTFVDVG